MRQGVTDRIDYWIRRRIVPCDALLPGNANRASDGYVGLTTAIGQHLRDQYTRLRRLSRRISLHSSKNSKTQK
jgi:hypothetical protein